MIITQAVDFYSVSLIEASSPMELARKMTDLRLEFKKHIPFTVVFDTKKSKYVAFYDDNTIFKNRSKK